MEKGIIHFRTQEAACLFSSEITGQISDGMWENSRPDGHWKFWVDADIVVDGHSYTVGQPLKSGYNVYALVKYVKEELKDAIRFARSRFYRPELMELKRLMTDSFYQRNMKSTPWRDEQLKDADPETESPYTWKSSVKKIEDAFNGQASAEFMEAAKAELKRVMRQKDIDFAAKVNAQKAAERKLLAEVGVTEETFSAAQAEIKSIEVSDRELKAVLDDVKTAISFTCLRDPAAKTA